jgi:hypothetical protein
MDSFVESEKFNVESYRYHLLADDIYQVTNNGVQTALDL